MTLRGGSLPGGPAREVCALAEASPDREVCGFVLEGPAGQEVVPAPNVAQDPRRGFLIAPEVVLSVLRRADAAGRRLVALYHSHPRGGARLSSRDLAELIVDGQPTLPGVELWVMGLEGGKVQELRSFSWDGEAYREMAARLPPFAR